jgi:adenosine deaminase
VTKLSLALIERLPKTDLHVHLDGSMRITTLIELAKAQGVALPADTPEGLKEAMGLGRNTGSLVEYLKAFDLTLQVLQDEESLYRVAYELAADAAAENVRYMEVRYSPMLHTRAS